MRAAWGKNRVKAKSKMEAGWIHGEGEAGNGAEDAFEMGSPPSLHEPLNRSAACPKPQRVAVSKTGTNCEAGSSLDALRVGTTRAPVHGEPRPSNLDADWGHELADR